MKILIQNIQKTAETSNTDNDNRNIWEEEQHMRTSETVIYIYAQS